MRTHTRTNLPRALTALAILTLLLQALVPLPCAHAQGESPADLRRENDALRNRVSQLEAMNAKLDEETIGLRKRLTLLESQLARLQIQIPTLRQENADLRKQLEDLGYEPGATEPGSQDEPDDTQAKLHSDPLACPPCLLQALRAEYRDTFADREITGSSRGTYIKDVRRWTGEMKREFRNRVSWTVEIAPEGIPGDDKLPVKFRVVDPDSRDPLHAEEVSVTLGPRHTRRFRAEPDQRYWVIDGVFFADPKLNPERETAGPLDFPPFIGPFAEFEFGFSVRSTMPAEDS